MPPFRARSLLHAGPPAISSLTLAPAERVYCMRRTVGGRLLQAEIESFLSEIERRSSPATVSAYRADLRGFAEYAASGCPDDTSAYAALDYIQHLKTQGYRRSSIRRKLMTLRAFCRWLLDRGRIDHDPFASVVIRRIATKTSPMQARALIAHALDNASRSDDPVTMCDAAVLAVASAAGLHRDHIVALDIADVDLEGGLLHVRRHDTLIPPPPMRLPERALSALRRYLDHGRPRLAGDAATTALFVRRGGDRLPAQAPLRSSCARLSRAASLDPPITPTTAFIAATEDPLYDVAAPITPTTAFIAATEDPLYDVAAPAQRLSA